MNIDSAREKFLLFLQNYEEYKTCDFSESDTRSKVIDKLFIDILGWSESNIQREGHVDCGYYDYRFSIPGFYMLVEAKKQFLDFVLPIKTKIVSINTLLSENRDVIQQIRNYLSDEGIDYGIITNGKQFIIGQFINHNGTLWKQNKCLVFNGLDEIKENFITFYNNLSKEGIIENGGFKFLQNKEIEFSKKIIETLVDREKEIVRNSISTNLTPIIETIFGEIFSDIKEDDAEFIKECFVENKETIKNRAELNGLFSDTPPFLSEVVGAQNHDSISQQINAEITSSNVSLKMAPPKPVIIVGSKGAGKTTFINFLFKNKLPNDAINRYPYVYVDFIKYYKNSKNVDTEKISEDILNSLYEQYPFLELDTYKVLKRIYIHEINRNDRGIWSVYKEKNQLVYVDKLNSFIEEKFKHKELHLEELSKYLVRERQMRLIVIIDNADQFDMETQESAFLFASSLNRRAFCGVFVSLREGYYYKWRNLPPFNAFESNVYHVTAPKYSEVLQKRISYTLKKIEFDSSVIERNVTGVNQVGYKIEMETQNIKEFFLSLQNSLFDNSNELIVDFLNYSTFPNTREGLRLFKLFLISGYTDVSEYIMRVRFNRDNHKITIPIHEFVKSIGLHNKLYYNHEISVIPNLFYPCNESSNHFLKIWILKYLSNKLKSGGNVNKYDSLSDLANCFINYGYKTDIIYKELELLLKLELIETDEILTDIKWVNLPEKVFNVCISAKGYYYLNEVMNRFYYFELVLQDTPIFDEVFFNNMCQVFPHCTENGKRNMNNRIETVECFMRYLGEQENHEPRVVLTS